MATTAAITSFREKFFNADALDMTDAGDWGAWEARRLRYDVLWAYYQGNAYRTIHTWSKKLKADFGLYRYIRDVYNPAFELGQFYKTYIWGGRLDDEAGDGVTMPSALPILTGNEALRPALAQLWQWSNWKTKRKLIPLYGAILGDSFLQVVDDPHRKKVYMKIVHPGIVKDVLLDPFGNVKGYTLEYAREDQAGKQATYTEIATRGENQAVIETYKNGQLFDWDAMDGEEAFPERVFEYDFIPLIFIPHQDVGLTWGVPEAFPKLALFREVDDQVSKLNDQVRKTVDAPWLFSGIKEPKTSPVINGASAEATTLPEPGRQEIPALYATDPQAKATPLVAPLEIEQVSNHIGAMLEKLEKVYPELSLYRVRAGGDLSGRAVRLIRQDAEAKVHDYRDVYDGALVRAQQMALAIGGLRGYFTGLSLDSYASGALDHQIGDRPVFPNDMEDDLDLEKARLANQESAIRAGWSLPEYLRYRKYDEDTIQKIINSPEYQAKLAALELLGGGTQGG